MKRPIPFAQAVGDFLEPQGFVRKDREAWFRRVGDYEDVINLQVSRDLKEITVNLRMIDRSVQAVVDLASPVRFEYPLDVRLGAAMTGCDRWWPRADPQARQDIVNALSEYGLPFLDRHHSSEALVAYLEKHGGRGRSHIVRRPYLAVLLDKLGRRSEACELLFPPNKWQKPEAHAYIARLRDILSAGGSTRSGA